LSEAKAIIERNLLVTSGVFVETSAMASIKNRLNNINNRMRGYS
jgi:predicted  nucleic acid-binding Zn-ribbon protein